MGCENGQILRWVVSGLDDLGWNVPYDISTEIVLWCKISKSLLNLKEEIYLGITYVPPEYSSREKRLQIDHFQNLIEKVSTLPTNRHILIGDFNARTKDLEDRLMREKHDDYTPSELFSHIKTKRCNQDTVENRYGKLTHSCYSILHCKWKNTW